LIPAIGATVPVKAIFLELRQLPESCRKLTALACDARCQKPAFGLVVETLGVGDVQMNRRIARRRSGHRGRHAARMRGRKAPSHSTELPYCQGAQPPAGIPPSEGVGGFVGRAWAAAMLMPPSSTATASKLVMIFIGVSFELRCRVRFPSKPEWLLPMRSRTDRIYSRASRDYSSLSCSAAATLQEWLLLSDIPYHWVIRRRL
jgi:hypothetical protein